MILNIIGDIFCDILASKVKTLPSWGSDVISKSIDLLAGGSALNSCCHASSYVVKQKSDLDSIGNITIKFFSAVGNDLQGQLCIDTLKKQNDFSKNTKGRSSEILNISGIIEKSPGKTGSCIVISSEDDRCFVSDRGVLENLVVEDFKALLYDDNYNLLDVGNEKQHLHVGGYYNLTKIKGSRELCSVLKACYENGISTSLNPQYDALELWDGIQYLCPYLTILIANEEEVCKITNVDDYKVAAEQIWKWGCNAVVITLAEKGACMLVDKKQNNNSPPLIHVSGNTVEQITDSTGAGDAFTGVFLVEWMISNDFTVALEKGCLAGSLAITVEGGSNVQYSFPEM